MAWDKTIPSGTKGLNLIDDDHRTNNEALEDSLSNEHDFTTAGTQSGRHKFLVDTQANRDLETDWVDGSIALVTDLGPFGSTKVNLDVYTSGVFADQVPPVYPDEPIERSAGEWGTYTSLSVVSSEIDWDWDDGNAFKVTLTSDAELQMPTGNATGSTNKYQPVVLYVTQDGTGGWDLTYETGYQAPFGGSALSVSPTAGDTSMVMCQLLPDDTILVTVLPDVAAIP